MAWYLCVELSYLIAVVNITKLRSFNTFISQLRLLDPHDVKVVKGKFYISETAHTQLL